MPVRMTEVYRDWINDLADRTSRARIQMRVDRLAHGNPGQNRHLTHGVSELKIDVGPGYRVYYTEREGELIITLGRWRQVHAAARHQDGDRPRQAPLGRNAMPRKATRSTAKTRTVPYDVAEQLRTPEEMAAYLDAWLTEAPDDAAGIARALGDIARAKGMTQVARDAGLSRESLYKALSENGNPSFATVLKVARALGVRLHAEAA
jgi:probable addiction module antidote protein/putative addiction module killer protein